VEEPTSAEQALLYRLSGDYNTIHADPEVAQSVGFDRPIIHGLCTLGHAARHVLAAFAKGDAGSFRYISVSRSMPPFGALS
jgi:3-hydroxyacyl-CoA dehydrogenase/3a,7a,12a-trihydroxy-5b-cholest-24-enoyl-CoA hydratase